jgi:PAS domain-containing protein
VRRRQARIIVLSAIVPLLAGSLTDVWLPRAGAHGFPNMAPDFTVIWVLGLVYAIVRYRMLELTPAVAADRVVETIPDALFLLEPEGRIAWANPAAGALLGHSNAELRGLSIAAISGCDARMAPSSPSACRWRRFGVGWRSSRGGWPSPPT